MKCVYKRTAKKFLFVTAMLALLVTVAACLAYGAQMADNGNNNGYWLIAIPVFLVVLSISYINASQECEEEAKKECETTDKSD